jgi:hypothetical protein
MNATHKNKDDKHFGRRFAIGLLASTLAFCSSFMTASQSNGLERAVEMDIEREFAAAMSRVAALRETNRSTAISVDDLFKPISDKHSLSEFRDFLAGRYQFERVRTVAGNSEHLDIEGPALKQFDSRFLRYDKIRIGFYYDSEWKNVVGFFAGLLSNGYI